MQAIQRTKQYLVPASQNLAKGAAINFPVDAFLRDKMIVGVEAFAENTLTFGDNGQAIVPTAEFLKCSVTLTRKGTKIYDGFPLQQLDPSFMFGIYKEFVPTVIDWNLSFVKVNDAIAAATPFSFGFNVHYLP